MSAFSAQPHPQKKKKTSAYRFLRPSQIEMIDEALCSVGEYGEVRLIVEKSTLRFLVTQQSFDTLKWQPGSLDTEKDAD